MGWDVSGSIDDWRWRVNNHSKHFVVEQKRTTVTDGSNVDIISLPLCPSINEPFRSFYV